MIVLEFPKRIPRWRQIAESLGRDLREDRFADGWLPTEEALALRFGVNRHTVRRAIAVLERQGLVHVEHGRGTFVGGGRAAEPPKHRARYIVNAASDGDGLLRRLIRATRGAADARTAKDFGIDTGAPLIAIEALGEVDGAPVSFEVHRFRAERVLTLPYAFMLGLSIADALATSGVGRRLPAVTRLSARLPSDAEARYLEQPASLPVLQIEQVHVDAGGVPVHCSTSVFPADRIEVVSHSTDVAEAGSLPERSEPQAGQPERAPRR